MHQSHRSLLSRQELKLSQTVSDHLLERLTTGGVHRIYGYPGDGINGIMGAMNRAGGALDGSGPLEYVQVRHEEDGGVHGLRTREVHR